MNPSVWTTTWESWQLRVRWQQMCSVCIGWRLFLLFAPSAPLYAAPHSAGVISCGRCESGPINAATVRLQWAEFYLVGFDGDVRDIAAVPGGCRGNTSSGALGEDDVLSLWPQGRSGGCADGDVETERDRGRKRVTGTRDDTSRATPAQRSTPHTWAGCDMALVQLKVYWVWRQWSALSVPCPARVPMCGLEWELGTDLGAGSKQG